MKASMWELRDTGGVAERVAVAGHAAEADPSGPARRSHGAAGRIRKGAAARSDSVQALIAATPRSILERR